jgi:hypothetical protein
VSVEVGGKAKKMCEESADCLREEGEIAEASEQVVRGMMEFKGRRRRPRANATRRPSHPTRSALGCRRALGLG